MKEAEGPTEGEGSVFLADGQGSSIMVVAGPEWGDEIVMGDLKIPRPLNDVAKRQLASEFVPALALVHLHDHFEERFKALEAEIASLKDST